MTLYTNALFGIFGKDTGMCLFKQAIGLQPDHGSCETLVLADRLGVLIEIGSTRRAKSCSGSTSQGQAREVSTLLLKGVNLRNKRPLDFSNRVQLFCLQYFGSDSRIFLLVRVLHGPNREQSTFGHWFQGIIAVMLLPHAYPQPLLADGSNE